MAREWETEITRDGDWPFPWAWKVRYVDRADGWHSDLRLGYALTKERARKKAIKARLSMERDDVRVVEVPS